MKLAIFLNYKIASLCSRERTGQRLSASTGEHSTVEAQRIRSADIKKVNCKLRNKPVRPKADAMIASVSENWPRKSGSAAVSYATSASEV